MSLNRAAQAQLAKEIEANRPVKEWDSIPELKKWKQKVTIKGKEQNLTLDQMVTTYKDLDGEIKFRETSKLALKEAIESAMLVSDEESFLCEGYRVARITKKGSRKVSTQKLLEQGVSADIIARATEIGKESSYVDIRPVKEPGA